MLSIRGKSRTTYRDTLYAWSMQEQVGCRIPALASNAPDQVLLLLVGKLVAPCTRDIDLESDVFVPRCYLRDGIVDGPCQRIAVSKLFASFLCGDLRCLLLHGLRVVDQAATSFAHGDGDMRGFCSYCMIRLLEGVHESGSKVSLGWTCA